MSEQHDSCYLLYIRDAIALIEARTQAGREKFLRDLDVQRVEALPEVRVGTGYVRRGAKKRREQKAVDVQLAVDALEWAFSGKVGAIGIVSGDADFAPLADAVRRAGPYCIVLAFRQSVSDELAQAADRVIELPPPTEKWVLPDPTNLRPEGQGGDLS